MRVVIVGLGIQGRKRRAIAGTDVVATVDPVAEGATFEDIREVPVADYDAALVCVPDEPKVALIRYLAEAGKHALVEKPLFGAEHGELVRLADLVARRRIVCYTAYNHRFEPHFVRMRELIASGALGKIYLCRMHYGNGTARDVRGSSWRDRGAGVLPDLGSHLLDTVLFWFDALPDNLEVWTADRFENHAFDHVLMGARGTPAVELEMTLLSWRNTFTADVYGELGSAHIDSLCKWGPSVFTHRKRVLPSGRPPEESVTVVSPDPTWEAEYRHFTELCREGRGSNLARDIELNEVLSRVSAKAMKVGAS